MDFKLQTLGGSAHLTFEKSTNVFNNLLLSLTVQRGTFFANPEFGSRLHELATMKPNTSNPSTATMKNTATTRALIPEYVREATQWMVDLAKVTRIETVVEQDALDFRRVRVRVSAFEAGDRQTDFETFVTVG